MQYYDGLIEFFRYQKLHLKSTLFFFMVVKLRECNIIEGMLYFLLLHKQNYLFPQNLYPFFIVCLCLCILIRLLHVSSAAANVHKAFPRFKALCDELISLVRPIQMSLFRHVISAQYLRGPRAAICGLVLCLFFLQGWKSSTLSGRRALSRGKTFVVPVI